jgi:vacuolar protein sorting-associated protein 52
LLQQIALLRRPQTNVRLIQVHGLLTHGAALYDFLEDCDETHKIAPELFAVYTESMSFTIKQLFRTYSQQLLLLDSTRLACTRTDVIAIDEVVLRESVAAHQAAVTAARQNRTTLPPRVDPFALGQRAVDCIVSVSTAPIAAHVAVLQKEQYPYERLWGSVLSHLLDAVTNEHVFCRQFFKRDAFAQLFSGTLSLLTEQLENYLFTCHDALCILLLIKVTHTVRSQARRRTITALDGFLEQVTRLLWPRLKTVMDAHIRSLRNATAVSLGLVPSTSSATMTSSLAIGGQSQPSVNAHYVSRRCGEFCCSILLILNDASSHHPDTSAGLKRPPPATATTPRNTSTASNESIENANNSISKLSVSSRGGGPDETQSAGGKLLEDVSEMMDDYVQLLERLAEEHSTQKKRTVFLINNLDHVVSVFQERRVTGKECTKLLELLMKYREDFVEEELLTGFSKMIAFVQQTEAHMASVRAAASRGGSGASGSASIDYDVNPSVVEALVLDFASHWKSHIDQINRNVLSYFSNFRNGMEILKHCLTQLLLYYTRFQDIIRKVWKKPAPFSKDLVSTTVILTEIKKYALAI